MRDEREHESLILYRSFNWRLGFRDVSFDLSFLCPLRPSDNTTRAKILDRTSYRNRQQLSLLCDRIARITTSLYLSKPVLHLRICVQHVVVAQEAKRHTQTEISPQPQDGGSTADGPRMNLLCSVLPFMTRHTSRLFMLISNFK